MSQSSYSVLNTVAASHADVTLAARKLNVAITSTTGTPAFPTNMDFRFINLFVPQPALVEAVQVSAVSFTAAANTVYEFVVTQNTPISTTATSVPPVLTTFNTNSPVSVLAYYKSDATGADADIQAGLAANINANSAALGVVATTSTGKVTLTGQTGTPLFSVTAIANCTVALAMKQLTGVTSDYDASPVSLFTKSSHGLVTGNVIQVVSGTGDTAWVAGAQWKVIYASSSTFSLLSLTTGLAYAGATADLASGVLNLLPQVAVGVGTVMAANGIVGASSGYLYSVYTFRYGVLNPAQMSTFTVTSDNVHTLYVQEGAAATTGDPSATFPDFDLALRQYMEGFIYGGTTANPQALGVANTAV